MVVGGRAALTAALVVGRGLAVVALDLEGGVADPEAVVEQLLEVPGALLGVVQGQLAGQAHVGRQGHLAARPGTRAWRWCTSSTPGSPASADRTSSRSRWAGTRSSSTSADDRSSPTVAATAATEMPIEAIGSSCSQPVADTPRPASSTGGRRRRGR